MRLCNGGIYCHVINDGPIIFTQDNKPEGDGIHTVFSVSAMLQSLAYYIIYWVYMYFTSGHQFIRSLLIHSFGHNALKLNFLINLVGALCLEFLLAVR